MVGAMQATPEELETAMRRIQAVEDREIRSQLGAEFAIWAGLNYNKIEVEEFRGRFRMVTAIDLWNASPVGQEALAAGRQLMEEKARAKGLQEGRQEPRGHRRGVLPFIPQRCR